MIFQIKGTQHDEKWKKVHDIMKFFKPRDKVKSEKLTEILLAIDGKKSESSSFTITIIKMDILYETTAFRHLMTGNTNCNLWGRQNCWGELHDYCRLCLGIHCRPQCSMLEAEMVTLSQWGRDLHGIAAELVRTQGW